MNRPAITSLFGRGCAVFVGACLVAGCGDGTPSSSSSEEKAAIKGTITYEGKPVKKGKISFDPSNINRRMASASSVPIGADGTYSATTLVGLNTISFDLPGLATPRNRLNYSRTNYEVKSGENQYNIELPIR